MNAVVSAVAVSFLLSLLLIAGGAETVLLLSAAMIAVISVFVTPLLGKDRLQLLAYSLAALLPGFLYFASEAGLGEDQTVVQLIVLKMSETLVCLMAVSMLSRPRKDAVPAIFTGMAPLASVGLFFAGLPAFGNFLPLLCGILFAAMAGLKLNSDRARRGSAARTIAAVAFGTLVVSAAWTTLVGSVSAQIENWLNSSAVSAVRGYPRGNVLGSMVPELQIDPTGSALRIRCSEVPGYVRGRAYDSFDNGRWFIADEPRSRRWSSRQSFRALPAMPSRSADNETTARQFFATTTDPVIADCAEMEVWNDPMRGKMYFAPLGTHAVAASKGEPLIDSHGVIRDGLSTKQSYLLCFRRECPRQPLAPEHRARLLQPLEQQSGIIREIAKSISSAEVSAESRMVAVEEFFDLNFEYSDEGRIVPSGVKDQLGWFLRHRPSAHCEYFATAAVALLRELNVPSRYVVGYFADLPGDDDDIWFAPNSSAHAWVEAYDDDRERWVIVEPTPGRAFDRNSQSRVGNFRGRSSQNESTSESDAAEKAAAAQQTNQTQNSWLRRLLSRQSASLTSGVTVVGFAALCILGFGLNLMRNANRNKPPEVIARERLEKAAQRIGLRRQPRQTLNQFSETLRKKGHQLPSQEAGKVLNDAARLLEQYAAKRYSGDTDDWTSWMHAADEVCRAAGKLQKLRLPAA